MTELERAASRTTKRSSDRPTLVVAALALAAVVGLSMVVGFVGAPHWETFSWEIASIFGTALGTTLLAAATGWLAWSTRSEARATQELAALTRRQQTASERPVVLREILGWSGTPDNGLVSINLRNVGLGPALRVRVSATYTGHPGWPHTSSRHGPGHEPNTVHRVDLHATFPEQPPGGVTSYAFEIAGSYLDRSMLNTYEIITSWPED
jgi:hypothetical protein